MNATDHSVQITDIKIYRFDIPLRAVFEIASMSMDCAHNVLIEIQTNEGITGWGEASPFHALVGETQSTDIAAAKEFKRLLIGEYPLEVSRLIHAMDQFLPHNTTIKSAFDMALHDIAARIANLPLYAYLGGHKREIETDMTIGICDPEEAGEKALAIRELGFETIKVKLGLDFDADYRRLNNIRQAIGDDSTLRIDANQGWDRIAAKSNLDAFGAFKIEFCEQPCRARDLSGMKFVSQHTSIPIMADESLFSPWDALNLVRHDIAPYFNVKFSKSGGIHNAAKICHIAEAAEIPCMLGCMSESKLGITAAAHFAVSSPAFQFFDLDSHLEHAKDAIAGGITIENGFITLPDAPGIGAVPDSAYLSQLEEVK
ncbi:L-Ala-D/L-Glu epimerase [Planctomycetes bacterium CA13]|uniref:Dipeptide epimerase n=1 Tax=Novipirellula herctigrandis TaxID=2527986 RepID=A0A5C5YYZ5_9BACT|nr:L-Ala-D/L-Glu epimerase [Planctomycetes bacterium CA13]